MGGRGSSSGLGGSAQSAKMPELKGSPKQVKWANELRSSFMKNADHLVKNSQKAEKNPAFRGSDTPTLASAKQVRADIVSNFQKIPDASFIIDRRNAMTYDFLKKAGKQLDYEMKRGWGK